MLHKTEELTLSNPSLIPFPRIKTKRGQWWIIKKIQKKRLTYGCFQLNLARKRKKSQPIVSSGRGGINLKGKKLKMCL